jgi:hypothetical protein
MKELNYDLILENEKNVNEEYRRCHSLIFIKLDGLCAKW